MITCYRTLIPILLTTLLSAMVVLAENSMYPLGRKGGSSYGAAAVFSRSDSQIFLENRIQSDQQTKWTKRFLAKKEAVPHSAPYVVSIQMLTPDNGFVHYCAGTILNEHWILTAAHCLTSDEDAFNSVIMAGAHDIHASESQIQMRTIDHYVRHDLYLGGVNPYDIALIYTRTPLQFNEFVQPAQLPDQDEIPDGYGTLYGWGNVSMTSVPHYPHRLQEANMPILDMELCEKILSQSGLDLHETNLCTGPLTGGVSICTADSGGPLIQPACKYLNEGYVIIGIVSWGKMPCGQKNAPSVFVRVSAFTDWINQVIMSSTPNQ